MFLVLNRCFSCVSASSVVITVNYQVIHPSATRAAPQAREQAATNYHVHPTTSDKRPLARGPVYFLQDVEAD